MKSLEIGVLVVYGLCLLFIFCYSVVQLHLTWLYLRSKKHKSDSTPTPDPDYNWPSVTVQLPVYNELYVVERLIDAVAAFDYPADKLQIQVLDDSTDETTEIIAEKVAFLKATGLQIDHVQRLERTGFKAGALEHGLQQATGEFVAIFDADFVPESDFLRQTIPAFSGEPKVGVVQTRWGHINAGYSILTRLQAFGLNAHFSVEQQGRNYGRHFINFNGTAGVWRKSCIQDAGGWQSDTLTEDLDLSYRAQLKGWRFKFLEHVEAPAELPAAMAALKSQQYRWTKGAAETAKKHVGKVIFGKLPLQTKLHAIFHLLNSTVFICVLLSALLSVPALFIKDNSPQYSFVFKIASVFLLSLFSLIGFYWIAYRQQTQAKRKEIPAFTADFLLFLSISMGLSLHNALAVVAGYSGRKTPFIRTPKFNLKAGDKSWQQNKYITAQFSYLSLLEGLLALYFLAGIVAGFVLEDYGLLPFHTMLTFGFAMVFYYSVKPLKNEV